MKKSRIIASILTVAMLIACVLSLTSCLDEIKYAIEDKIRETLACDVVFMVDGEEYHTIEDVDSLDTLTAKFPENPAKEGYTFRGWQTEDGATLEDIDFSKYLLEGKVTLVAEFEENKE